MSEVTKVKSTSNLLSEKVNVVLNSESVFEISREVAEQSLKWRNILKKGDDEEESTDDEEEESTDDEKDSKNQIREIRDFRLDDDTFKKVLSFLTYHNNNPYRSPNKPLETNDIKKVMVDKWDAEYLDVKSECLKLLVDAAHYLKIPSLMDATVVKISCQLKGYTDFQARKWFGLDVKGANSTKILA